MYMWLALITFFFFLVNCINYIWRVIGVYVYILVCMEAANEMHMIMSLISLAIFFAYVVGHTTNLIIYLYGRGK